jgi:hypothetical protein
MEIAIGSEEESRKYLDEYIRLAESLVVAAQDSRPSGSLLLSCKAFSPSMLVYPGALASRFHSLTLAQHFCSLETTIYWAFSKGVAGRISRALVAGVPCRGPVSEE